MFLTIVYGVTFMLILPTVVAIAGAYLVNWIVNR